ncbi:carbon-nitrogen family hydrolase [Pseudolysinimonas kribbensis]|uniref:carbon-nitrogen hydrolase family protein n=1 Tax=Pseudolysinimonas kribbensis TaxID=433641 RepID=UPI0031D87EBE
MTTIGIAQWLAAVGEPDRNLRDALTLVDELARRGCDLIVLPELWPCGYDPATLARDARDAAEPLDGPRGRALAAAALAHEVWLFAGTVPELDGNRLYNTALVYGPDGALRATHRKTHLYFPLGEDTVFAAGDGPTVLEIDGLGTVGLSTCFDGDHPDFARTLHDRGARIVVSPCAYEVGAESWWDLLYPANALANGQWWIMANQRGGDLLGASRVIAPDGSILAELPRLGDDARPPAPETLVVSVDLQEGIDRAQREAGALWAHGR